MKLLKLVRRLDGQTLPELGPSLVIFRRPFSHLYFAEHFVYCGRDCNLEIRLLCQPRHARGIFANWHNVEFFPMPPRHRSVITLRLRVRGESGRDPLWFAFLFA